MGERAGPPPPGQVLPQRAAYHLTPQLALVTVQHTANLYSSSILGFSVKLYLESSELVRVTNQEDHRITETDPIHPPLTFLGW